MATINSGVRINTPGAPVIAAGASAGSLSAGAYTYRVTFVTNFGETGAGTISNSIVALNLTSMSLTSIPVWTDNNVISRKIYRTTAGGSTYLLAGTIADNTTTTYTDTLADGSLGAAPPAASTADSLQVINGWCSFQRPMQASVTVAVTAFASGGQASATLLFSQVNIITVCASIADSVLLPLLNANIIGIEIEVKNNGVASCNVFPGSAQTINALGANTAIALAAGASARYRAVSATNWQSFA
jgi:hypothetical protein